MKIPGFVYTLLYSALTAALVAGVDVVEQALRVDYADWIWAPVTLALLGGLSKTVEVWMGRRGARTRSIEQRSRLKRFWLG